MVAVTHEAEIVERVLCDCVRLYPPKGACRTIMSFDKEHGQFLLLDEGWDGYRRIHNVWVHIELRDGKIWIHEDGTEEGVANLLVAAGVPHDHIVLAFHAPNLRQATGFAIA